MLKYMLRRVLQMIPVLFIITIITFLFVNASGDPTAMLLPPEATAADREVLREALGLNEPLYVQYGIFIKNALHGDFGTSFRYGTSAMGVVMEKMPATLQLASVSLLCSILVAIPLGILSAHTKDSPFDVVVSGISSLGRSMPSFWVGIMLILLFGVTLKVLPVSGRGTWLNLVLPCATLTINTATQIGSAGAQRHAGDYAAGLYPHRPQQGHLQRQGGVQARLQKRPGAGGHHCCAADTEPCGRRAYYGNRVCMGPALGSLWCRASARMT